MTSAITSNRTSEIRRVLLITLVLNIAVSGTKVIYGYIIGSVAMLSDGFHSLFDGVSNIVGLIGIHLASNPPDKTHPYGHRKYETVFTIFVGILMFMTCIEIFKRVYASFTGKVSAIATTEGFVVMLLTTAINIFVTIYEKKKGEILQSEYLSADAMHTKSDIYVSFGVVVGLVFIRLGFPIADPIVGTIVGMLVAKAGIDIIKESTGILVDSSQSDICLIKDIVCGVDGVIECHEIRTRGAKNNVFVDLHVMVAPYLSVEDAHRIADKVEEDIKKKMPDVVDVIVHIEPSE